MTIKRLAVCKLRFGQIALAILFALCGVNLAKAQLPVCNPLINYAPQGQIIPGFPPQLILDSTAVITNSYSANYSTCNSALIQYSVAWNSSQSMTSLYDSYIQYLPANGWPIINEITQYPDSRGLYARNALADMLVSIVAVGTGSNVAVSILLHPPAFCSSFADVVRNGVPPPTVGPGRIDALFQPKCGLTLKYAAQQLGGYDHFNWEQVVTEDPQTSACWTSLLIFLSPVSPECLLVSSLFTSSGFPPLAPYIDPPHGGYLYQVVACGLGCGFPVQDNRDWYWDEKFSEDYLPAPFLDANGIYRPTSLEFNSDPTHCTITHANPHGFCGPNSTVMSFEDEPSCQILNLNSLPCTSRFSTTLVGVRSDGTGDLLNFGNTGFDWHVSGTTIGVDQRRQNFQADSGTTVFFDGFKLPGVAGFTQPELELFAKNGINIRDEAGVVIPVIIDIKPGEFPNSINPNSRGTIPIAIISTTRFHAPDEVDQHSLTFGRTGSEALLAFCHQEDVNGDGLMDLVCHFYTSKAAFQTGDTEGILKGKTFSGTSLYGKDSVRIVPPR